MRRQDQTDSVKVGWICDWPEPPALHAQILQFAFDEAYEQGVVDRPIELVIRGAHGLPRGTSRAVLEAYKELKAEGVLAVYGPQKSENLPLLREYIEGEAHIPTVAIAASESFYGHWCFGVTNGALGEEPYLIANFLAHKGIKRVTIVIEKNRAKSREYLDAFNVAAQREGIEIGGMEYVSHHGVDLDEVAQRITRSDAECVFYIGHGYLLAEVAGALERAEYAGMRVTTTCILTVLSIPGGYGNIRGWIGVDQYDEENVVAQEFLDKFQKKTGTRPANAIGMFIYDTARVIAHGIGLAENLSPAGVRDGLEKVKWLPAVTGSQGSMLNLGRYQHRAWFGAQYLVMREILQSAGAGDQGDDSRQEHPTRLVHRYAARRSVPA